MVISVEAPGLVTVQGFIRTKAAIQRLTVDGNDGTRVDEAGRFRLAANVPPEGRHLALVAEDAADSKYSFKLVFKTP